MAVGSTVVLPSDGGSYALYYLFPMGEEQQTLLLLRQVLLYAGVLLLLLIAGVALLVTRQVITPVRLARRVAERIASGRLEERMHVRGEDDIARLATSFNQMAEAMQSQIRRLVELSRVQRTFVSDVSHELRTPLTTVRMAGDVIHDARAGFDPVTARAAELLQKELDRFENLLGDLLEISRFDAGAAVLELDDVNVGDVAHRVVNATAPMAMQRGVPVTIVDEGVFMAEADARRLERIIRNLVTNAIDHADASGVSIRLATDGETTALTVRDHGIGLEPGQSAMVFNRFWRGDPARARTTGGTGLGLAIALEDARLHGGWLQAWGAPKGGAQFRLTLPRHAGDPISHSPLPLVPPDLRGTPRQAHRLHRCATTSPRGSSEHRPARPRGPHRPGGGGWCSPAAPPCPSRGRSTGSPPPSPTSPRARRTSTRRVRRRTAPPRRSCRGSWWRCWPTR